MDSIIARGLIFQGCHGVEEIEKTQPQEFKIDLELFLDLEKAGKTDDLENTIDYGRVFQLVKQITEKESFNLIEALADRIARVLLHSFPLLQGLEVTIYKPQAPVSGKFDYFAVKIKRFQK
jgi:dihydroneopterin aldolase